MSTAIRRWNLSVSDESVNFKENIPQNVSERDNILFEGNKDEEEESVSVLSMYTALQKDIFNILPIGKKHDMIIIPQLE